jgi:hypothetical protein
MTTCRQDLTSDDLTIDCGYVPELVLFCRTPGFWGARADSERGGFNYTGAAIEAAGGCLNVCDVDICQTGDDDLGHLGNALEAICVRSNDKRSQLNQMFRQATAAALNCAATGDPSCSFLDSFLSGITWEQCNDNCALGADANKGLLNRCYKQLDCFNNGGIWDEFIDDCLPLGQCEPVNGLNLNTVGAPCFDENDCGEGYTCVGNCHVEEFCNLPTGDFFETGNPHLVCSDESDDGEEKLGPASSSRLCNTANRNDCTISNYAGGNVCEDDFGLSVDCCDDNPCVNEAECGGCVPGSCGNFTACDGGGTCLCFNLYDDPGVGACLSDASCGVDCTANGDADCAGGEVCIFDTCCGFANCVPAECTAPFTGSGPGNAGDVY